MAVEVMTMAQDIKNWKLTRKKKYNVYMCRPALGTKLHDDAEDVDCEIDNKNRFVLSGTVGEKWAVSAYTLMQSYILPNGRELTAEALAEKVVVDTETGEEVIPWTLLSTKVGIGQHTVWAMLLPIDEVKNFRVNTAYGQKLMANRDGIKHGPGDFLMATDLRGEPNLRDLWVVNGEVFGATYDLRGFHKLFSGAKTGVVTPKPDELFNYRL